MEVIARVSRVARVLERHVEEIFAVYGLARGGFDVLAALRRSGPPYRLSPTELYRSFLISSSAITNRIDRLEEVGLVVRMPDPHDRRGVLVGLTARGHRLIDEAVEAHLANEAQLLSSLTSGERETLVELLSKLLVTLSGQPYEEETIGAEA
ncbi:MAG TPA: MarR family transcriptional regulator [Actinomycetes bacterium]|nr:MarR family transcriptional regulator [Actinomycetes bacterium]